jgi:hypothetical protein
MKSEYKILLIGCLTIACVDAISSVASRQLNFNYGYLTPVSILIYGSVGFWGTKKINLKTGVLIAAITGFLDATAGWQISILLKANTGDAQHPISPAVWAITLIFVTALGALCGRIGGGLAKVRKNKAQAIR